MVQKSKIPTGYKWALALTATTIAALFSPHIIEHIHTKFTKGANLTGLAGSIAPQRAEVRMAPSLEVSDLFSKLEDADLQWRPQEELLPDGSSRYLYKRRAGERDMTVAELRSLINDPPTFDAERKAISNLLETLRQAGVRVMLTETLKKGAAAEWDHSEGVMRIQPQVSEKGTLDFMRVLNHEAIHVAQSCRSGSLHAKPKALGVPIAANATINKTLADPVYANVSDWERELELEAYSLQNDIKMANALVSKECKLLQTSVLGQG